MNPINNTVGQVKIFGQAKLDSLYNFLNKYPGFIIALSGGIDSRFLTFFSHIFELNYQAVTFYGPHLTDYEIDFVKRWVEKHKIKHNFVYFDPLKFRLISSNTKDRCYFCKKEIFTLLKRNYGKYGYIIIDGTNYSDLKKYRPGIRALNELKIISPLADFFIEKNDIKFLGNIIGLDFLDQYSRSCLLTRFDYNIKINKTYLLRLREIENFLLNLGLLNFRVRVLKNKIFLQVDDFFKELFFSYKKKIDIRFNDLFKRDYELMFSNNISGYFDKKGL
ncbi:ATP-dependent sacrificial sulfur transferase LarE [Desulfohalobiaceae bacterium Ax17]|uniref:ATP-dependent sacrificial sulfur transferase LarE n=1 Tax=Desulfovulcanus ferrireducens TaxID=2831190 RepID=UPI00207BB590|nr:ATP-dependent sacrificial sulfur transferase LarE [Desulfovulcanus ferrireducens]MBT8763489.1 ATP-dependent sacrificial sulfur transferase LarE [Desulfovulcanus ferrireducens]